MKPLFTESQRFTQWWFWLIVIFACGVPFVIFFQQIILGNPVGDHPMSNSAVILSLIIPLVFILLFYVMQLKTEINRETLSFRDRKSTRLNSSHVRISYAVFCL